MTEKVHEYLNLFTGKVRRMTEKEYDVEAEKELPGIVARLYESYKTLNLPKERKQVLIDLCTKYKVPM